MRVSDTELAQDNQDGFAVCLRRNKDDQGSLRDISRACMDRYREYAPGIVCEGRSACGASWECAMQCMRLSPFTTNSDPDVGRGQPETVLPSYGVPALEDDFFQQPSSVRPTQSCRPRAMIRRPGGMIFRRAHERCQNARVADLRLVFLTKRFARVLCMGNNTISACFIPLNLLTRAR